MFASELVRRVIAFALLVASAASAATVSRDDVGVALGVSRPTTTYKSDDHDEYPRTMHLELPALG